MFGFHREMQFPGRHGRSGRDHGLHQRPVHAGPRRGGWEDETGGFGHPGHGRRGGGRRMFDGGELRLLLLKLIADKPRHGYDLIRAIEERTAGAYAPSPGIVYPTLTMLSEMGLIEEQVTDGARKQFAVTSEGAAHLDAHAAELAAITARLDALGAMRERIDAAPVRRAMHNLRSVLQNRLGEGLDKTKLHEAVALIDEVAGRIERL
ncbi:PadR family transcriptional regulator [Rhodopseudomonas thermotolerans]|uniref:PadR family transcriptional regulator n=3 Tax=Nitrobacteraceae TaxID=41294 RepID=A0A336JQA7_9BRAD|nr:PadR family transcriptional regulator [Rhodopseudomonas pentothenatexigens]REF92823.1 PadR family transcriptional regulator [Rhodopseudomonas thermotolerans]SSW91925.1 PadR family transcriptional regulator [Rhodopseudomonas pentothenatexigens]